MIVSRQVNTVTRAMHVIPVKTSLTLSDHLGDKSSLYFYYKDIMRVTKIQRNLLGSVEVYEGSDRSVRFTQISEA